MPSPFHSHERQHAFDHVKGHGRRQLRYARSTPKWPIPSPRSSETTGRKAKTEAKRAGSLTETLDLRRVNAYQGSWFVWIRPIWEMSVNAPGTDTVTPVAVTGMVVHATNKRCPDLLAHFATPTAIRTKTTLISPRVLTCISLSWSGRCRRRVGR